MPVGPDSASTARPAARRFTDPLPRDLIDDIASIGRVRRVGARSHVCHEGEPCDSFCVVRKGVFRVQLAAPDGRSLVLGQLGEGEYFGEAALDAGNRMASIVSCSRGELICLTRTQFVELMAERPDFAKHVLVKVTRMLRSTIGFTKSLALLEVEDRVKILLLDMAEERDGRLVVRPRPSQQAIADRVGASRSMINRVLKQLASRGFAVIDGNGFLIRERPRVD